MKNEFTSSLTSIKESNMGTLLHFLNRVQISKSGIFKIYKNDSYLPLYWYS